MAGGGYFRLLPTAILQGAVSSMLSQGRPVILYCHPYEWNPREMDGYRGRVSPALAFTQSLGRRAFARRMRRLFARQPFGRFDQVVAPWRERAAA